MPREFIYGAEPISPPADLPVGSPEWFAFYATVRGSSLDAMQEQINAAHAAEDGTTDTSGDEWEGL